MRRACTHTRIQYTCTYLYLYVVYTTLWRRSSAESACVRLAEPMMTVMKYGIDTAHGQHCWTAENKTDACGYVDWQTDDGWCRDRLNDRCVKWLGFLCESVSSEILCPDLMEPNTLVYTYYIRHSVQTSRLTANKTIWPLSRFRAWCYILIRPNNNDRSSIYLL